MSNIFIDGSTRVGKDFLIDNLVEGKFSLDGIDFSKMKVLPSNYSFLSQFSSDGGTDAMFINSINIASRIPSLMNCNSTIINRSLVSDFAEYLVLALVNRYMLSNGKKLSINGSSDLSDLISLIDDYPQYLKSSINTLKKLRMVRMDSILLIDEPLYDPEDYLSNLGTDKAKFHYYAITNRLDINYDNISLNDLHNQYRLMFNELIKQLCHGSFIELSFIRKVDDENFTIRRSS